MLLGSPIRSVAPTATTLNLNREDSHSRRGTPLVLLSDHPRHHKRCCSLRILEKQFTPSTRCLLHFHSQTLEFGSFSFFLSSSSFLNHQVPAAATSTTMDLPRDIDGYIKETIDDCLGLPISSQTLEAKLRASQESERRLRQQNLYLLSKLKEKEQLIERSKSEATMNAQALKKFVEENQRLASECENLLTQCQNWEKECALYEHDREALMEFGNDADERAREANSRVLDLERDLLLLQDELKMYKHHHELVDSSSTCTSEEGNLLDSLLATLTSIDDYCTYTSLEANCKDDYCMKLLTMWNCLKPSTQRVLSLVAKVKSLEKDKEHLTTNLHKAEEEVKLLFDENNTLEKENKMLLRHYKERNHPGSGGKHTSSASCKSNKRKSSPRTSSPVERKIDFDDMDSARQPLSPLRTNSPDCRMHKK